MTKKLYYRAHTLVTLVIISCCCSKLSAQDFDWVKPMSGKGMEIGRGIAVDQEGNSYTTGYFMDSVDFDPGPGVAYLRSTGGNNIFVAKLDARGNYQWAIRMGSSLWGDESGYGIAVDDSGYVYVTGNFGSTADFGSISLTAAGNSDIFVAKLDAAGNVLWAKAMGGTSIDLAQDIAVDNLGSLYITGRFMGKADFNPAPNDSFQLTSIRSSNDIFIAKLTTQGEFVWARSMGGSGNDEGYGIVVDERFVYATGYFKERADFDPWPDSLNLASKGADDIFTVKLDTAGQLIWAKAIGGQQAEWGNKIAVDGEGNVYTTGQFRSVTDFDPGPDSFKLSPSSTTITWGSSTITLTDNTAFVSKWNAEGQFVWAAALSGTRASNGLDIGVDKAGNVYSAGNFIDAAMDFDPGPDSFLLTPAGSWDAYILKLDSDGHFAWAKSFGGKETENINALALHPSGHIYTTGCFQAPSADFNPGPDSFIVEAYGSLDIFVHKLLCHPDSFPVTWKSDCKGMIIGGQLQIWPGLYTEVHTGSNGCDSVLLVNLEIEIPQAVISVDENVLSTQSFATYQWLLDGQPIDGATDSFLVLRQNGDYAVIVSNGENCIDTSETYPVNTLSVVQGHYPDTPIFVYPNPAQSQIHIASPVAFKARLITLEGRTVLTTKGAPAISIKDLADGIYLLQVNDEQNRLLKTEKIIKQ